MNNPIPDMCPECGAPLNFEISYNQSQECPQFVAKCSCGYIQSWFEQNIIPKPKEVVFSDGEGK